MPTPGVYWSFNYLSLSAGEADLIRTLFKKRICGPKKVEVKEI